MLLLLSPYEGRHDGGENVNEEDEDENEDEPAGDNVNCREVEVEVVVVIGADDAHDQDKTDDSPSFPMYATLNSVA